MNRLLPKLSFDFHKGSCGRIAIVGGSQDYTGAPYFAAMASLRVGCDLAHVFTHPDASIAIKTYSPDVIVSSPYSKVLDQLTRFHAVVAGPGLGRDESVVEVLIQAITSCTEHNIPMVLDADALFFFPRYFTLLRSCRDIVLTPNVVELKRLSDHLQVEANASAVAAALGGPTVVVKGMRDVISDGTSLDGGDLVCDTPGSPRRVCGQGDILCGLVAAFMVWGRMDGAHSSPKCALAACHIMKRTAAMAFDTCGRGIVTSDLLLHIHKAVTELELAE